MWSSFGLASSSFGDHFMIPLSFACPFLLWSTVFRTGSGYVGKGCGNGGGGGRGSGSCNCHHWRWCKAVGRRRSLQHFNRHRISCESRKREERSKVKLLLHSSIHSFIQLSSLDLKVRLYIYTVPCLSFFLSSLCFRSPHKLSMNSQNRMNGGRIEPVKREEVRKPIEEV